MMWLIAYAASAIALAVAAWGVAVARRMRREYSGVREAINRLAKRVSLLESIVGRALEVLEGIDEARRLKMKRRRRYVAALILYNGRLPIDPREVQAAVDEAVRRLGGVLLLSEARPQVVYYEPVRGVLIVRTNHLAVDAVIAALLLIERIGGVRVHVVPLRTAGTLSSAKRFLGILEKIPARAG